MAGTSTWVVGSAEVVAALVRILGGDEPTAGTVLLGVRNVTRRRRRRRAALAAELRVLSGGLDLDAVRTALAEGPRVLVLDLTSLPERSGTIAVATDAADEGELAVLALDTLLPTPVEAGGTVQVICAGLIVETLEAADLAAPMHPFARRLLPGSERPIDGTEKVAPGPVGCPWRESCERAQPRCSRETPPLARPLGASHPVACHYPILVGVPGQGGRGPAVGTGDGRYPDEPTAREFVEE